jgi:adenosylcobinamide kinase / adenosylcobinamide-phosphate guanylyltransferase
MSERSARRVVLVLGGVRSGKSRYAQELATRGRRVGFIATAEACDDDMRQRIARHRQERPASWTTFEVPLALEDTLLNCGNQFDTILIDCLTVWTANIMQAEASDEHRVLARADRLAKVLREIPASVVLVSNEVGSGVHPDTEMGRTYRDLLGFVNQRVAAAADEVILLVAGCPLFVKQSAEVGFGHVTHRTSVRETNAIRLGVGTTVEEAERLLILRTLQATANNKTRAAEILGISLKTLHNKLKEYGAQGAESVHA